MRRALAMLVIGGLAAAVSAQPVVLKQNVLDGGGRAQLASAAYRCGLSLGQTIASGWVAAPAYRAVLGFWCRPFAVGGVGEQVEPAPGTEPGLGPCRPNPFGARTQISYVLGTGTHVCLLVYDRKGSVVGTLVNARQPAGRYRVTWDISGVAESALPSGVYFLKMEAGQYRHVQKAVVAR